MAEKEVKKPVKNFEYISEKPFNIKGKVIDGQKALDKIFIQPKHAKILEKEKRIKLTSEYKELIRDL